MVAVTETVGVARGGDAHPDATLEQLRYGVDDLGEVLGPAHLVVHVGVGRVERDLDGDVLAGEHVELRQAGLVEQRAVAEHERGQDVGHGRERRREVGQQERLATGHADVGEAQLRGLGGDADHLVGRERPLGHARSRLGEAVGAGQVAVVVGVHPHPAGQVTGLDGLGDGGHPKPSWASRRRVSSDEGSSRALQ